MPVACKLPYCNPPVRGGVGIYSTENPSTHKESFCTAGAYVKDANGYNYILTAGHCVEGSSYYNYPHPWWTDFSNGETRCTLGLPIAGEVSTRMDAQVIEAPGSCGSIAASIVEWGVFENYPVQGVVTAYPGLYVCHMGASSGNQCGPIEAVNIAETIGYDKGPLTVEHLDRWCGFAWPGDSGGPVQYGNPEWTYLTAITIATSEPIRQCPEGGRTWGYEIKYAEAYIGVHVVTK